MQIAHHPDACHIRISTTQACSQPDFPRQALAAMLDSERQIILDFSQVSTMASMTLANLLLLQGALKKLGKSMLLSGLNEHNQRILSMTRTDRLLNVQRSVLARR